MERLIFILILLTAVLKSMKLLIKKTRWFIEKLKLYIKQFYVIVSSVEKNKESKNQNKAKMTNTNKVKLILLKSAQCVLAKNLNIS